LFTWERNIHESGGHFPPQYHCPRN
jgi:hypothetical protein